MTRLGDILNTPSEYAPESSYSSLLPIKGRLKFDNVIFRYHPKAPAVLDSLSLEIHSGEIVGLVGQSGSGKSTLAKLLLRLFPIESGRIQIDGVDLAMTDTVWLRQQIGVVLQENILFSGTIRESIAMSDPSVPMEKVEAAARMAGAHDFITELQKGYDTQVGERGANLSGGQRQRLAIARILIGNPRILIFDEATSALDFESENIIHQNMGLICKGRTAIIIAHRLSSVRLASRIFVLDKGRLVESGPPKKLMEQRGYFYRMVMAQSPPGPGQS